MRPVFFARLQQFAAFRRLLYKWEKGRDVMPGKKKCKMLREIRRKIADENDIPFVTEECRYKGDCKGTCPKCESELRYLEEQLEKRRALGVKVTVSAVALGMVIGSAGCSNPVVNGMLESDVPYSETSNIADPTAEAETHTAAPEEGEIGEPYVLEGAVAYETEANGNG